MTLVMLVVVVVILVVLVSLIVWGLRTDSWHRFRMSWASRNPNPEETGKLDKAKQLLINDNIVKEDQGIEIMAIHLMTQKVAGSYIGLSVPKSFVISIQDTWLNNASTNINVIDLDTRRLAIQLFGESQHAILGDPGSPEADKKLQDAIKMLGLENDPEVRHWHHGD